MPHKHLHWEYPSPINSIGDNIVESNHCGPSDVIWRQTSRTIFYEMYVKITTSKIPAAPLRAYETHAPLSCNHMWNTLFMLSSVIKHWHYQFRQRNGYKEIIISLKHSWYLHTGDLKNTQSSFAWAMSILYIPTRVRLLNGPLPVYTTRIDILSCHICNAPSLYQMYRTPFRKKWWRTYLKLKTKVDILRMASNWLTFVIRTSIYNKPALVQLMTWPLVVTKPLSEPMIIVYLRPVMLTHWPLGDKKGNPLTHYRLRSRTLLVTLFLDQCHKHLC